MLSRAEGLAKAIVAESPKCSQVAKKTERGEGAESVNRTRAKADKSQLSIAYD